MSERKPVRRAVLTGLGPVSAIGIGLDGFDAALADARTGIRPDTAGGGGPVAAMPDFRADEYLPSQKTYLDRASAFAFAAFRLASDDAGLELQLEDPDRVGLCLGTADGCLGSMDLFFRDYVEKGPRAVRPFLFPHVYSNTTISLLAIEYGIRGVHVSFAAGFTAGSAAIAYALDVVRAGRADVVFAGGFDALVDVGLRGLSAQGLRAPAGDGAATCRPLDARACGMAPGEGAGILVVEELEHARRRGAHVHAELAGAAMGAETDLGDGRGGVAGAGLARVMRGALADAGMAPGDIDFVSGAADGIPWLDGAEVAAAAETFSGSDSKPVLSSIKGAVGEARGAAGALQAISAARAMETGRIPPTVGLERGRTGLTLPVAAGRAVSRSVRAALVNAIDPGGAAVSLVLRRHEADRRSGDAR